jgi:DNA-directed RNA polymerase specialized sigma24 family protein
MLADVPVHQIPLMDVDEEGYPALWPLLLKYIERHCNKWNKYYRAKKRQGKEVALGTHGESQPAVDPAAAGPSPAEEAEFAEAWEVLEQRLAPRQYQVATLAAQGRTLEQIARELGCSETTVSNDKKAIRSVLEKA